MKGIAGRRRPIELAIGEEDFAALRAMARSPRGGPPRPQSAARQDRNRAQSRAALNKHKMAKHFETTIQDDRFEFRRREKAIGVCVVRTNLPAAARDDAGTVAAYKRLGGVERAFRGPQVRPIFRWASPRVKAHVLLCMLAHYVEHHNELTDKGSINQRAVLAPRAERVEELYAETPSPRTIV
jgi:hypothetical protein